MINISIDKTLKKYLEVVSLLGKHVPGFTQDPLEESDEPTSIYIGKYENRPNHNFAKSIYEISIDEDVKIYKTNDFLFLENSDEESLNLLIKRIPAFIDERQKIIEQFSQIVHDIAGEINHVNGYSQLLKIKIEDEEMQKECDILTEAGKEINKKIFMFRKESFKVIF